MSERTDKELIEYWRGQIKRGEAAREKYAHFKDWERWEELYEGIHEGSTDIYVNETFAQIRSMIPRTYFRNPSVRSSNRAPGHEGHARLVETVDNWLISEMNLKAELKRGILIAALTGTAFLKYGYDSEYGFSEDKLLGPLVTPEGAADLSAETVTQRDQKTFEHLEYNASIQPGRPWVLCEHPKNVVVDPDATSITNAKWVAHRILRPVEDVRADPKWKNNKKLAATHQGADEAEPDTGKTSAEPDAVEGSSKGYVEVWEINDARTERVLVLCLIHSVVLRDEIDMLQIDGLPWGAIVFNARANTLWGISDVQLVHAQQLEMDNTERLRQSYRRSNKIRFITKPGLITKDEKKKFTSEDPIDFVEAGDESTNLDEAMRPLPISIPPDLAAWSDNLKKTMQDVLGLGSNQMGNFDRSARRTATEAGIVEQNVQIRVDERRDIVADALVTAIRRCNQMIFKWWTAERAARVAGPDGQMYWVNYTGADLKGEYDLSVEPDDALPLTRESRRQNSVMLLQTLGPMLGQMQNVNGVVALARHVIRQFGDLNPDEVFGQNLAQPGAMPLAKYAQMFQGQPPAPGGGQPMMPGPQAMMQEGGPGADMGLPMPEMPMGGGAPQ